ncbi:MAG: hypothetical protein RLY16_735 [Bacteroidota bacterium]
MAKQTLVVIGGGAAGFFCAVNAARLAPNLRVVLLEKSSKLLSKVRVSGGGRCNVTHHCFSIAEMIQHYPRGAAFLKKAFHHFFTTDTIEWFNKRGVPLKVEADNRMFPQSNTSETIVQCLMEEANKYQVEILMNRDVQQLSLKENGWEIHCKAAPTITCDYVCIATGGFPKLMQFDWIQQLGHTIETPQPSLFTFNMPGNPITQLMGVAVEKAMVKINTTKLQAEGPLLITHWGMSGPAILKLSAHGARLLAEKNWHFQVSINWAPTFNEGSLKDHFQQVRFQQAAQKVAGRSPIGLPARLWQYLVQLSGISDSLRWADLPAKEQNKLIKNCCAMEAEVKGKTTFKEEFVTAGGVQLTEVDHFTMESKKATGLYFAGEVLDVDGVTGGFNFQNAWTTGFLAAQAIAIKANEKIN